MNHKLNTAATTLLMTLLAIAADTAIAADDEHAAHHPTAEAATGSAATTVSADAMANMKKMQEQMAAIRAAKDPQQRAKLMDEHMQTMQSTMQMMRDDMGCPMMDKEGMGGMMKGKQSGGGMNMMQMMMDQMMQHQKAMQGPGK